MTDRSYRGVLTGRQIEWTSSDIPDIPEGSSVQVVVTVVDPPDGLTPDERRNRMADILAEIAAGEPFADITDPVAWQREMRRDRKLPGRDD
jgi:hypothetical protein